MLYHSQDVQNTNGLGRQLSGSVTSMKTTGPEFGSLVLGLKACITTTLFLWQTSVATEIKGVCHHCQFCKDDQGSCFIL